MTNEERLEALEDAMTDHARLINRMTTMLLEAAEIIHDQSVILVQMDNQLEALEVKHG